MEKIKKRIMNGNGGFYIYFALYAPQLLFLLFIGIAVDFFICFTWTKLNKGYGIIDFCRSLVLMELFSLGFFWIMLLGWN